MDIDTLKMLIIEEIKKNQQLNGIEDIEIDSETKPLKGLASFDSLTALEVLTSLEVRIEDEYEIECELDVSVFFTDEGKSALRKKVIIHNSLTVHEIAENILKTISK
jgi:hypothetical protein